MKMICLWIICGIGFFLLSPSADISANEYPIGRLTALTVDEERRPIVGAEVWATFLVAKVAEWGINSKVKKCLTNQVGLCTVEGEGVAAVGISGSKEGFYEGGVGYSFQEKSSDNRWEPWNPIVEVMLKKKRNPIPMYAQYTGIIKIPEIGVPVGYDLEKGDWVSPYGKGTVADFVFTLKVVDRGASDYQSSLTLTFSNDMDGIQRYVIDDKEQSCYRWPFLAPDIGYVTNIEKERSFGPVYGYKNTVVARARYVFRVRTKVDKNNRIVSARYGKLNSDFDFGPDRGLIFSYYFNPDGTRNLEFDPERNLFHWSSRDEEDAHRLREP